MRFHKIFSLFALLSLAGIALPSLAEAQEPIEGKVVVIKKSEKKSEEKAEEKEAGESASSKDAPIEINQAPPIKEESKGKMENPPAKPEETPIPQIASGQNPDSPSAKEIASDEEAAVLPLLDNYLKEYRLGPTDIISVDVFGQPNYSKSGITIPPTAKISYYLIRDGIFVGGKTVEQVADEIAKKLDEFIIDPKVTVTLDRAQSARYSIFGKVTQPGVRIMDRRLSLYEAIVDAGSFAKDADRKRIAILRRSPQGGYSQMVFSVDELLKGKGEMPYLQPGDQVVVPEKKWSLNKFLDIIGKASAARILFGSPF